LTRFLIIGLAGLILAGCSQFGGETDRQQAQQQWLRRQQSVQQFEIWDVHARAVAILPGAVYHVGIRWQRDRKGYTILLEAPFGQGVFRLESTPGSSPPYRLSLPDGQVFESESAEALLDQVIGWSIPISGLEYWIRGIPRPGSDYSHLVGAGGRLKSLEQDGWSIRYRDYFSTQDLPRLPRRMQLVHSDLTLKLVVEYWQQSDNDQSPSELFPEFN